MFREEGSVSVGGLVRPLLSYLVDSITSLPPLSRAARYLKLPEPQLNQNVSVTSLFVVNCRMNKLSLLWKPAVDVE
jgi:hypothetical protein